MSATSNPGFTAHSSYYALSAKPSRRAAALAAFDALVQHRDFLLRRYVEHAVAEFVDPKPDEDSLFAVPWWIINTIANGWNRYRQAPSGTTLGEVFRLEGGGQGSQRAIAEYEKKLRDQSLALNVFLMRREAKGQGKRLSLEDAYYEVAEKTGTSFDIVKRAYKNRSVIR